MNSEQEIKAWALAIAVLMKGGVDTNNFSLAQEKYATLAKGIKEYLQQVAPPFSDKRFNP